MTDFIFEVTLSRKRETSGGKFLDWWDVYGPDETEARKAMESRARVEGYTLESAKLADVRDENFIPSRLVQFAESVRQEFGVTVDGPHGDGSRECGAAVALKYADGWGVSLVAGGSMGYDGPAGIELIRIRHVNGKREYVGHPERGVDLDAVRAALRDIRG